MNEPYPPQYLFLEMLRVFFLGATNVMLQNKTALKRNVIPAKDAIGANDALTLCTLVCLFFETKENHSTLYYLHIPTNLL